PGAHHYSADLRDHRTAARGRRDHLPRRAECQPGAEACRSRLCAGERPYRDARQWRRVAEQPQGSRRVSGWLAMRLWIRDPLALFTANDHQEPGGLVIEDNLIVELLAAGATPASPVDETFDAREHVVLPGLVNTHQHFHQTLTRAWGPAVNMSVLDWLPTLYPLWSRLTPEHLMLASRLALAELLLSGCTTSADHHYLFP